VLIHLPGLTLVNQMDPVGRAMEEIVFTVRGLYGEVTGNTGNLYQVSNQRTLGCTEQEIVDQLDQVVGQLSGYERRACETLADRAASQTKDRVGRAYGLLSHARLLGEKETLEALSMLRMGRYMGLIKGWEHSIFNQLLIKIQPAHLQMITKSKASEEELGERRADLIRSHMKSQTNRVSRKQVAGNKTFRIKIEKKGGGDAPGKQQ